MRKHEYDPSPIIFLNNTHKQASVHVLHHPDFPYIAMMVRKDQSIRDLRSSTNSCMSLQVHQSKHKLLSVLVRDLGLNAKQHTIHHAVDEHLNPAAFTMYTSISI